MKGEKRGQATQVAEITTGVKRVGAFASLPVLLAGVGCFFSPVGHGLDCGNGVVDGQESCDGADLAGATCDSLGLGGSGLACTSSCVYDTSACLDRLRCGDGTAGEGELCDGADLDEQTCRNLTGHQQGALACLPDCSFDTSMCHTCGDGEITGPESCDDDDLAGASCVDLGHDGGELRCDRDCRLDDGACLVVPDDWYDSRWRFRRFVTVPNTSVTGNLRNFPVLVMINDPEIAAQSQADGVDLLFTAADGRTLLDHEVERWEPALGLLVAWVRVESLSSIAPTVLHLYYGNPGAGPQENREGVWDEHYLGVWHLDELVIDEEVGGTHLDASAARHHGIQSGNRPAAGQIGLGQAFDGLDDHIDVPEALDLFLGDRDATLSLWVRSESAEPQGLLTLTEAGEHLLADYLFGLNAGLTYFGVDHGFVAYLEAPLPVTDGAWHYLTWIQHRDVEGTQERWELWIDGVFAVEQELTTLASSPAFTVTFGGAVSGSMFPSPYRGFLDEVRISATARSAEWIATTYRNQFMPESFLVVGPPESITVDFFPDDRD